MNDGFSKKVAYSRRIKSLPPEWIVSKEEWDSYYSHFTLRAKSLSDYILIINRLAEICRSYSGRLVFRGHSDSSSKYKLIPTIGRSGYRLEYAENEMVMEMLTLRPEEFSGIVSSFDLLSKLQHFGLPTRLLDFTYNPLVALYFACCNEKRTDSRIICSYDTSDESTKGTIENICSMYQYADYNAISLDTVLGGVSQIMEYKIHTFEPLMAKPKYANDRIKHQSAVFMVFPNAIYDYRSRMVVEGRKIGDEKEFLRFELTDEEEKRLEYVRKEPSIYKGSYYVTSTTLWKLFRYYNQLFPDFHKKSEFGIAKKYHPLFQKRFSVMDEIQELSARTISNSFVSILIESKYREKIIEELATVGIDKAFVFPELEYTAEMVRNKYMRR